MIAPHKFTFLLSAVLFTNCQSEETDHINIPPFLDIPRIETTASAYVEDIRSENQKYRVIIFDELFPSKETKIEDQKRILDNYIINLEQAGWEYFGTVENHYKRVDRVWRFIADKENCAVTIKLRLVDYYKEIGDVYLGVESHDRIQFQLTEDLSTPCKLRIPSKSFESSPTK